jgi:hypothetical protein
VIRRAINRLHAAWLRWVLASNEQWMRACQRDGIANTYSMTEWRKQADATRVQIAILERP